MVKGNQPGYEEFDEVDDPAEDVYTDELESVGAEPKESVDFDDFYTDELESVGAEPKESLDFDGFDMHLDGPETEQEPVSIVDRMLSFLTGPEESKKEITNRYHEAQAVFDTGQELVRYAELANDHSARRQGESLKRRAEQAIDEILNVVRCVVDDQQNTVLAEVKLRAVAAGNQLLPVTSPDATEIDADREYEQFLAKTTVRRVRAIVDEEQRPDIGRLYDADYDETLPGSFVSSAVENQ